MLRGDEEGEAFQRPWPLPWVLAFSATISVALVLGWSYNRRESVLGLEGGDLYLAGATAIAASFAIGRYASRRAGQRRRNG